VFNRLFDFILDFLELFYFVEIVDEYERGYVLRLGRPHREVGAGPCFYWPMKFERVMVRSVVPDAMRLPEQRVTVLGGDTVVVRPVIIYRVTDIKQHLLGVEDAETSLVDAAAGTIASTLEEYTWASLTDREERKSFKRLVLTRARREAAKWGVTIDSIHFADFVRIQRTIGLFGSAERAA
jgi:regulator of protease activity HflC (stomatin/prohibitin superfamily)